MRTIARRLRIPPSEKWVSVGLVLVISLFIAFTVKEVYSTESLFSFDPYYHLHLSEITVEREGIVTALPTLNTTFRPNYLSAMIPFTAMIHELTGIPFPSIYRNLGWIARVFTIILLFLACRLLMGEGSVVPLLSVIAFLASPYVLKRSVITFPENMAVAFHAGLFHGMVRSWKEGRTSPLVPLFFTASLYVHYMSSLIPLLLLGLFLIASRKAKTAVLLLTITLVLLLPIAPYVLSQYRTYLKVNVGPGATWKPYSIGPRYEVPSIDFYLSNLGSGLFLYSLLGLAAVIAFPSREGLIVAGWLLFALALSRGKQFGLYVPTDRMMMYLALPSALSSAFAFRLLLRLAGRRLRVRLLLSILVSLLLVTSFAQGLYGLKGWVGIKSELRQAADLVNDLASPGSIIIPVNVDWFTVGIRRYSQVYGITPEKLREVCLSRDGVREKFQELSGGRETYIMVKDHPLSPPGAELLFEKEGIRIYRYPGITGDGET